MFGGTYVLGADSTPESIEVKDGPDPTVQLKIPCHPRVITARHLIASSDHLPRDIAPQTSLQPDRRIARCIAVVDDLPAALRQSQQQQSETTDEGEDDKGEDDTAIVIFPPSPDSDGKAVRAMMNGEGTGSCPSGQCTSWSPLIVHTLELITSRPVSVSRIEHGPGSESGPPALSPPLSAITNI